MTLSWLADVSSLIGFGVGIVGFAVTIYQILKTKSVAVEAKALAQRSLDNLNRSLLNSDLSEILKLLKDFYKDCSGNSYETAISKGTDIHTHLSILSANRLVNESEKGAILGFADDFNLIVRRIRKIKKGSPDESELLTPKNQATIDSLIREIGKMVGRIQSDIMEAKNG